MIVADLFRDQSQGWESFARKHIDKLWGAARDFVDLIVVHLADASAASSLCKEVFEPAMEGLLIKMRAKTTELLAPHQAAHPITYNHDFTKTL